MVSGATQVEINDYTFRLPSFVIFYYTIENMRLVSLTLLRVKLRHGQPILLTWLNLGRVFNSLDVSAHESCTYFAVKRNCST